MRCWRSLCLAVRGTNVGQVCNLPWVEFARRGQRYTLIVGRILVRFFRFVGVFRFAALLNRELSGRGDFVSVIDIHSIGTFRPSLGWLGKGEGTVVIILISGQS